MDYEKAYKEAHSRAEMFRNTIYGGIAEEIFPDFRESSYDEKIRKELIEMVKEDWPGRSDVVDWLEKQGEQKPTKQPNCYELEEEIEEWLGREAFPEGTNITPIPKAMEIVRETANHFYDFGRKQQAIRSIQCTNSQVITPESYINEGQKKGIQMVLDNPKEYGLQKPADKIEPIVIRDFNSVFSREQIEEIDKRIEESQRLYNAKLRDAMRKIEDFPMTD